MISKVLAFGALALVATVPAVAQQVVDNAYPVCSAKIHDSCDQSTTTQRYSLTAAQAEATGGVGDRAARRAAAKTYGGNAAKTASYVAK